MNPKAVSTNKLLNIEELADNYLKKHTPSVDFKRMKKRDVSKFLINKV